jgi:hypothetical protein
MTYALNALLGSIVGITLVAVFFGVVTAALNMVVWS